MKFFKAKYDAATPTRVQVNVPTNTDYMVGTELYVKGEKKDITSEDVTLSPSPKQYVDEVITLKWGETNDWAEWLGNGLWSIKKPFTIKPHYYVKNNAITENKIYTNIDYSGQYDTTSGAMVTVNSIRTSTNTVLANIRRYNTTDAQTYGLTSQYSCLQANGSYTSEFAVEEGMQIKALYSGGAWVEADLVFTNKVETGILSPDTTVNGIPAFTMKSFDAEADKLYEVEFKSEITAYTALSGTSNDDFDYALSSNSHCWTAKKEFVLTAPIIYGANKEIRKQYTDLKLNRTDGTVVDFVNLQAAWTGVLTAEINGNIYQLWGISPKDPALSSLGDLSHMPLWSLIDQSHAYAFVTEPLVCPVGTVFKAKAGKTCGVEIKNGESYDYKFKLFVNEDEQSYGDIDLKGTTPAEVSAIVDDAIAAYDSQLSTVNLSGTFDDDSTFSYNFVIKN